MTSVISLAACRDELEKIAGRASELTGLGVLAVPSIDHLQATARARLAGDKTHEGVERRRVLGDTAGHVAEIAGLATLAAPYLRRGPH